MNSDEKKQLQDRISHTMETVKNDIERYRQLSAPVAPDNAIGRLTRMDAINNKSMNEASLRKAQHTLRQLEKALKMMDDPDFGLCVECDEPIAYKRLLIMPETQLCIRCAEKMAR